MLADEPTGNLDPENQDAIMEIFKSLAHNDNKCVIIVTHSQDVAAQADEVYELKPNKSKSSKSKKKNHSEDEDDDE